jgi:hypothetical protein
LAVDPHDQLELVDVQQQYAQFVALFGGPRALQTEV